MRQGRYKVIGGRRFRGHEPGTVFEAQLDRGHEARAIRRGALELLERVDTALRPGSYRLPAGWSDESEPRRRLSTLEGR